MLAHNINEGFRTEDIKISQDVTFDSMLLTSNTLKGLKKSGFYKPSPVQLHGIPLGKCGFDLLLEAKSGTGKTAVFSVILLEKLELDKGLQTLILAPTREIAAQICDVIKQIGTNFEGLVVEVVIGGLPVAEDVTKFKKNVHIVVGSPGRLRQLIQLKHIDVSSVRLLVLDEADKLMEKSFLADINYIFAVLPNQKQVIMSSATYPENIKTFINKYVNCAQHVCPDSNCVLLGVEQRMTVVKSNTNIVRQTEYRFEELLKILSKKQFKQCLIFCNYQARVYELYKLLMREKWPVEQLCGKQEQSDRLDALKTLQEYKCRILVSTDLAARGIDASNVDLVINFEPPFEWHTYLHRIGRAGRYGSYGMSVTILSEGKEENQFKLMLESINLSAIKITNFWKSNIPFYDDHKDIYQSYEALPSNNLLEIGFDFNELWKELIRDSERDKEKKYDFNILCKSFEESKNPPIESFSDLIHSFEISKDNVLDKDNSTCEYNIIKTKVIKRTNKKNIINKNSIKTLESNNNFNPIYNASIKENFIKDQNDNDICPAVHHNNSINTSKDERFDTKNNNLHLCRKVEKLCKNNTKTYDEYFDQSDNIEVDSTSRALREAGLPLSFSCLKKNKSSGKIHNNKKEVNRKIHHHNHKNKVKQIDYKETHNFQYKVQESLNKGYENNYNKNKRDSRPNFVNNQFLFVDNKQNYVNWYNQLKTRVKFIELAFYLNEMSTLH